MRMCDTTIVRWKIAMPMFGEMHTDIVPILENRKMNPQSEGQTFTSRTTSKKLILIYLLKR